MPTIKPRIAITLSPHMHEVIRRLSELNGQPMSRIVAELVEAVSDPLMRTVALLEAAAAAPKEIKDGLRGTVQQMERELYGAAGYTLGQMDWLINEMGQGERAESERAAVAAAASAPPSSAARRAKSNPHTVIRGSGQAKPLKSKGTGVSEKRAKKGGKNG